MALNLVSTALGGAIGFLSATLIAAQNARLAAGGRLRAAFAPELAIMRATPSNERTPLKNILNEPGRMPPRDVTEILFAAFERHAAAVEEYRFFVPTWNRAAYQAAWQAYYLTGGSINFTSYMIGVDSHELFCERVEAVLEFTRFWRSNTWRPLKPRDL